MTYSYEYFWYGVRVYFNIIFYPFGREYPIATMTHWVYTSESI